MSINISRSSLLGALKPIDFDVIARYIAWDDTLWSAGTVETEVKHARFAKTSQAPVSTILVIVSLWVDTPGATGHARFYVNNEITPRLSLSTTSTFETVLTGSFSVADLGFGIHAIGLRIYSTSGNVYTQYLEIIALP